MLALVLVLGGVAVLASVRSLPARTRTRAGRFTSSRVTTAATRAGLPPAAVTGVRFALEPGVGRSAVPVRSAILGAILAVTVVVATVTFGSSLNTLVSHPALYGWNWNYDMDGGGGLGDVPGQRGGEGAQRGSAGAGLDRRVLLLADRRRGERAGPGRHARGRRRSAPAERPRSAGDQPGGARRLDAALAAQAAR